MSGFQQEDLAWVMTNLERRVPAGGTDECTLGFVFEGAPRADVNEDDAIDTLSFDVVDDAAEWDRRADAELARWGWQRVGDWVIDGNVARVAIRRA